MKLASVPWRGRMPLLVKELIEQAARKRTYLLRVLYALGLYLAVLAWFLDRQGMRGNVSAMNMLGSGRDLLEILVVMQFAGIYLLLPVLTAGTIAGEKERNSLMLLLVTDLRPGEIVLQKYLGRLVPMLTCLLLALPVMALAYSLGGLEQAQVMWAAGMLLVCALQVGAIGVMASAFCRSTAGALIGTYVAIGMVAFIPQVVFGMADLFELIHGYRGQWAAMLFPPGVYVDSEYRYSTAPVSIFVTDNRWLWTLPSLLSALVCLLLARRFLVRRAMLPPRNLLLAAFRRMDAMYKEMNSLTGGIVLLRGGDTLPGEKPIAWWETTKRTLGQPQHLFRLIALLMAPLIVFVMAPAIYFGVTSTTRYQGGQYVSGPDTEMLTAVLAFYWAIGLLLLAVHGANTFAAERRKQTLSLLLTLPLTGREIVLQKMAALHRLGLVIALPLLTIVAAEAWLRLGYRTPEYRGPGVPPAVYAAVSVLAIAIYLGMITWLAMWLGMRVKHPTRSLLATLGAVVGYVVGVPIMMVMVTIFLMLDDIALVADGDWLLCIIAAISPTVLMGALEFNELSAWWPIAVNLPVHLALLLLFRRLALTRADRYLGRVG